MGPPSGSVFFIFTYHDNSKFKNAFQSLSSKILVLIFDLSSNVSNVLLNNNNNEAFFTNVNKKIENGNQV